MDGALLGGLRELAVRYGLAEIYTFGSRAAEVAARVRGGPAASGPPDSDIDIAVRPARGQRLGAAERADLMSELEDLLDAPRVDLVVLPEAGAFLAREIIAGELLYCADTHAQAEYELYVLRRAGDLAPFERERRAQILGGSR